MADRRENCFDFLRLVAAVAVVGSHITIHIGPVLWLVPGSVWSEFWFYDGVPMFFIISGYLVYASGQRCRERGRPTWDYGLNRFLRIVPALVAWAAVTVALWVASGFLAPNTSLWTIPAECSFYLTVPVILWLVARAGWSRTLPVLVAVAVTGMGVGVTYDLVGGRPLELVLWTFWPWAVFFLIGILWLRYEDRIPLRWWGALIALGGYVLLRSVDVFHLQANIGDRALEYAGAIPLSYLIFFIAYRGPHVLAVIPRRIGDLSYGTYIWHMPVIGVVLHFGWGWPAWVIFPATLGVAAVSWWFIEAPALRLKRYSTRWSPAPAGAAPEHAPAPQ